MVKTGLDILVTEDFAHLKNASVAVVANQASVDSKLRHLVDLLYANHPLKLKRIFAPEHGFRGALQDMEHVGHQTDPDTGVPIISLYGKTEATLAPQPEFLNDIDILIFDLQDIGSRYYTFVQTLRFCMEACVKANVKILVLDRPNPINGLTLEGSNLEIDCRSFCGYAPVANRHGLTVGEFATLMNCGFGGGVDHIEGINADLEIIKLREWKREIYFDATGLPWVLPSPNMPSLDAAIVYPGMCLFEATNISEGRGTTRPFELIGAPYINGKIWKEAIFKQGIDLKGVELRPTDFIPQFQKSKGEVCGGVQVHITDRKSFQPYRLGLAMIAAAKFLYPTHFSWRAQAYEFVTNVPAIDLLYGSAEFRETIDSGNPIEKLMPKLHDFETKYQEERAEILLY